MAAAAFLYAPYFAVDLFVRSAMGEFTAFPFFAFSLYGFGAYAKQRRPHQLLLGASAFAGVMLSHFPAALMFAPLLLAFLAMTAWMEKSWRIAAAQAFGYVLGLGLSAWSWFPAISEREFVTLQRAIQGSLEYTNHFVYLDQLFYSPWGYGLSVPGRADSMSFSIGWSHLLLAIAAWVWLSRRPDPGHRHWLRFYSLAAIVLAALTLQDAIWIWDHLPLLHYLQMPWRLLGPASLCLAMLAGMLGSILWSMPKYRGPLLMAALALLIVPNLPHLAPGATRDIDPVFWTGNRLAVTGFETTTTGEFTPRWLPTLPPFDVLGARIIAGDAVVRQTARTPFSWSGDVKAKSVSTLRMSFAYFPGWQARIDQVPVAPQPDPTTGLQSFSLPAGDHHIDVAWGPTPARHSANWISLLSLLAAAIWLYRNRRQSLPAASAAAASKIS